jgi:hypothetical protein
MRPVELSQFESLSINANAKDGVIRCELLDANGFRIRGFSREDSVPVSGDSLRHEIRWKEKSITQATPGSCMPRFHLEKAEIFAVTFQTKT